MLSAAPGKTIRYYDQTLEEAYRSRRRWPAPDSQYDAWVSTLHRHRRGRAGRVTGDVLALAGRPPIGLAELVARRSRR